MRLGAWSLLLGAWIIPLLPFVIVKIPYITFRFKARIRCTPSSLRRVFAANDLIRYSTREFFNVHHNKYFELTCPSRPCNLCICCPALELDMSVVQASLSPLRYEASCQLLLGPPWVWRTEQQDCQELQQYSPWSMLPGLASSV